MTSGIRLRISFEARQDIDDILQYTLETWGREQVAQYQIVLDDAFDRLREFPVIGRQVGDGIREFALRHHVILYLIEGDTVIVLRVMHPRRLRR